jgi:toluene monooxygenase system protein E
VAQKTYWHLIDRKRIPTEYDVVSSRLTYHSHTEGGFELSLPWSDWYATYQRNSHLVCSAWDQFIDPRHTTYASYTALQSRRELYVDGLLESVDRTGYDRELDTAWVDELQRILAPFRYPCHGFQMVASYLGEMAPTGTITLVTLFQAADEIRRIQRFAYRQKQLELPGHSLVRIARKHGSPRRSGSRCARCWSTCW